MFPGYFPKSQVLPVRFPAVKFYEKLVKILWVKNYSKRCFLYIASISGIVSFPGGRVEYFQRFIFNSTRQLSVYFTREFLYRACAQKKGWKAWLRWSHRRMKIVSARRRLHQRHSKIILRNTLAECSQQVKLLSARRFEALHYTQFSGVRLTLKSETRISKFCQFSKKACFILWRKLKRRKRWKRLSVFRFFWSKKGSMAQSHFSCFTIGNGKIPINQVLAMAGRPCAAYVMPAS